MMCCAHLGENRGITTFSPDPTELLLLPTAVGLDGPLRAEAGMEWAEALPSPPCLCMAQ